MMKRALWTTTATLALLSASSLFAPDAMAQKGVLLQPQTAWAVTNVAEGSGDPYCAIARRFRQNVIVTMAENKQGQASVALDFRDGFFKPAKTYDVTLDPGAGEERDFQMKPISEQAFVVRLGSDEAFFRALSQTGYLRLGINSQNFNLNLADIEKGRATLNSCLSKIKSAAKPAQSKEIEEIASRIEKLERENSKLRENVTTIEPAAGDEAADAPRYVIGGAKEVETLTALPPKGDAGRLDVLVSRLEELETKNAGLERQLKSQQNEIEEEYVAELERLQLENKTLQEVLAENAQSAGVTKVLEEKLSRIEGENEALQGKTAELAKLRAEMNVLAQENDELAATAEKIKTLENDLRVARLEKDSVSADADEQSIKLQKQVDELSDLNDKFEKDLMVQSEKQKELSDKLVAAEAENKSLQAALDGSEKEISEKKGFLASLQDQITSLTTEKTELSDDLDALKESNAELMAAQGSMNLLRADNQDYQAQVAALEDAKSRLQASIDENKALNARLSGDKDALETLIAEKEHKNEALVAELQEKLQANVADAAEKEAAQTQAIASLEKENTKLLAELEEAQLAGQEVIDLKEKLAGLNDSNQSLRTEHEDQSAEIAALQKDFKVLKAQNEDLAARLAQAQTAQEKAEEQLASLRVERDDLMKKVAVIEVEREELSADVVSLQKERDEMNDNIASLSEERDELNDKVSSVEEKREALEKQLASLSQKTSGHEQVMAALRAEKEDLTASISALSSERDDLQDKLAKVEEKRDAFQVQVSALTDKGAALEDQVASLSSKSEADDKALATFKVERADMQADIAVLKKQRDAIQSDIAAIKLERDALQETVQLSKAEKSELKEQLAEAKAAQSTLELAIADLKSQNDTLEDQLQVARNDQSSDDEMVQSLQNKLAGLQERNKDLTAELAQQQLAYAQLEKVVMPLKTESSELRSELKALSAKFQTMQTQLHQRDAMLNAAAKKTAQAAARAAVQSSLAAAKETSQTATIAPIERVVQAAVSQKPIAEVVSIEPAAGDSDIVVNNRPAQENFKNTAQELEQNMVTTIRETETGFEEVSKRAVVEPEIVIPDVAEPEVAETVQDIVIEEAAPVTDVSVVEQMEPKGLKTEPTPVVQAVEVESIPAQKVEQPVISAHEEAVESTKALLEETGIRRRETAKEMSFVPPTNVKPKPVVISKVGENNDALAAPVPQRSPVSLAAPAAPETQAAPVALTPAAPSFYQPSVDLASVLRRANVNYGGAVNRVDDFSNESVISYQWQGSNGLYGSAQQKPIRASVEFDSNMQAYLDKTKQRCSGDFAVVPSQSGAAMAAGVDRLESYEVACVGGGVDSAASILFFSQNGTFTALAHETPTANMQTAMDIRDQIMKSVSGS